MKPVRSAAGRIDEPQMASRDLVPMRPIKAGRAVERKWPITGIVLEPGLLRVVAEGNSLRTVNRVVIANPSCK